MKEKTKIQKVEGTEIVKKKSIPLLAVIAVVAVIAIMFLIKTFGGKEDTNFITVFNKMLSTKVGNCRYVIEVQTSKHTAQAGSTDEMSVDELNSVASGETADDAEKSVEEVAKHNDKISNEWDNTEGTSIVDWNYPNYKLIIEGRTESVDPMRTYINVEVATQYSNGKLFDATIVDGKCYLDLIDLRKWLVNSKDKKFTELGLMIPEGATYVIMDEDDIHFYSIFAEDSEYEISGTHDVDEFYNRFLILEQTLMGYLSNNLSNNVLVKSGDKYGIKIEGDDSLTVYSNIKNCLNNASSLYSNYITSLKNNGQMTDEQVAQAVRERDNFLAYIQDRWIWINSASTDELSKHNLKFTGIADTFADDSGANTYEVDCTLSYTDIDANKDVIIKLSGAHTPLTSSGAISIPTSATQTYDRLGLGDENGASREFVNVISSVMKYFDVFGVMKETKLDINPALIVDSMISDFIDYVNKKNQGMDGFVSITKDTVFDYIDKYSKLDNAIDSEKANVNMVKGLLSEINNITGSTVVTEVIEKEAEVEQFREVTADVHVVPAEKVDMAVSASLDKTVYETEGDYRIIANINEEESKKSLAVIDAILLNTSDIEMTIDLSRLSLQDLENNKYPCNYEVQLHEYDNGFDMEKAPVSVTIPVGGYVEVKLYAVIDNGWRYYDLFSDTTKLGDIVAY